MQAIGLSRGGQTTKMGRPAVIRLTPGNVSDIRVADDLIEAAGPVRRLIADRGYDANRLRLTLRSTGTIPIIPGRRSRKCPIRHDKRRYRDRWRIEAAFCRLKDFRRVGHTLRQARGQLLVRSRPRRHHRILGLNESGP